MLLKNMRQSCTLAVYLVKLLAMGAGGQEQDCLDCDQGVYQEMFGHCCVDYIICLDFFIVRRNAIQMSSPQYLLTSYILQYFIKKTQQIIPGNMNKSQALDLSQRKLRLIKSQKYLSHLPQQQYSQKQHSVEINNRFTQLRILTKQKDKLMNQLTSLKQGALTALQEKEQIIDRLKNQSMRHMYFQDQKEQMQKELNKSIRKYKEVLDEKNQISEKYQKERIFFFQELYNKQAIIDQLSSRISNLHVELDNSGEQYKKLQIQLLQSEANSQKMRYQITQLKQQIRQYYKKTQTKDHHFNIEHYLCYKCLQNSPDSSPLPKRTSNQSSTNIQQLKLHHQQEIQELINFYQNQIKIMRSFCEKEIGENCVGLRKTLQTQICSDHEENQSVNELASLVSYGNSYKNGFKSRLVNNLKNELKQIKNNEGNNDDERSQFTNNYFLYENKNQHRDSLEATKNINIQDNLTIITQESRKQYKNTLNFKPGRKQILWCLGGSLIGAISALSLMKLLSNMKK